MTCLTDIEFYWIEQTIKLASKCCAINSKWDNKLKLQRPRAIYTNPFKSLCYVLCLVGFVVWIIYSCWRLDRIFMSELTTEMYSPFLKMIYIFQLCSFVFLPTTVWYFAWAKVELALLWNQLITFCIKFDGDGTVSKSREKVLAAFQVLIWASICNYSVIIGISEGYFMWTLYNCFIPSLLIGLATGYLVFWACCLMTLMQMYMFLFLAAANEVLLTGASPTYSISKALKAYQCLTLLCKSLNQSYGTGALPGMKLTMCLDSMLSLVLAIKLRHVGSSMTDMLAIVFLMIFICANLVLGFSINMLTDIWQRSHDYVWNVRHRVVYTNVNKGIVQYNKLVAKCLQPLRFEVGRVYTLEKVARLTLADFLISGIVNSLILLQM